MKTYPLKDFKTWLETQSERKQNLTHWEDFFRLITNSDGTIKEEVWTGGLPSSLLIENRYQYSFILKKWKEYW